MEPGDFVADGIKYLLLTLRNLAAEAQGCPGCPAHGYR